MDDQVRGSELEKISMVGSPEISDIPEVPDIPDVFESTGLSPLTSSLDHTLTFQEDNLLLTGVDMGIEDTWTEASSATPDYAIPLPAPPGLSDFADVGADPTVDTSCGLEHGPFLPSNPSTLNNLFADAGSDQDDALSDIAATPGVCGLHNLGNTCFMAAGLQCLTATPPVYRHFLDLEQRGDKAPPGSLMAHFGALLNKMWSGRYSVIHPTEFKQSLGTYHSQFKDYRQHDCQEFLALLLDTLHEQMNTAKSAKNFRDQDLLDLGPLPSPECPGSPNITVAGSPRGFDSSIGDLDSTANSPRASSLNDADEDEETLDSDETVGVMSNKFIHNKMDENSDNVTISTHHPLRLDALIELSKKVPQYSLYDIHKEAKTSNANFLVTQQDCNNEIHYDSQKFPKDSIRRTPLDNSNLMENHDFDNKNVSVKRIKEINMQKINLGADCTSSSSDMEYDTGLEKCNVKRMRLDDQEKNHKFDGMSNTNTSYAKITQAYGNDAIAAQEEIEADKHWAKHLRLNRSVIVDTFQGQFKSTVICAVCKHVSITYEPFMYLSVPLPHAMERQLSITYVPANGDQPTRCVVSLNKQLRIGKLKEELLKILGKQNVAIANVALAEVLENHIAKILDDNTLLKYVNDTNRSIYAFELTDPPDAYSVPDGNSDGLLETDTHQGEAGEEIPCTICLHELDGELKKHSGSNCNIIMCDSCIENYFKNYTEPQMCPICSTYITASSFTKIDQTGRPRPAIRILNVPVVLRYDTVNETTNNRKSTKLFGHPHLIRLPSRVNAKDLHEIVKQIVPQDLSYTLHFVDGQGHHCSRCMYTAHCTGCNVPEIGMVMLQNGDTLAVRYTEVVHNLPQPIDHISVSKQRPHHPLSLYDCLQAFSQSETLDEHNPWFCPKCERNQCATKTLTVHRYPKFLIVYLKRFVFYECTSMKLDDKVTFPLVGLSVGRHLYDLYACVCHFGGVSAGHYTAYAKNPRTDIWYYYNDEATSRQKPQDEDFSNAYILFYSRQGTNLKPCNL